MMLEPKNRMIAGQLEQVQHSATLRLQWTALQETLKLEALGMFNFTTEEVMLRPKASYDITDALTAAVGAELYFGPDETLFGTIADRLQRRLRRAARLLLTYPGSRRS